MSDEKKTPAATDGGGLKRNITFGRGVATMGGIMIGSGIFYTLSYVLDYAHGSSGIAMIAWVLGGLMVLGTSLCFAEMGSRMPEAGGTYLYISRTYKKIGPPIAFAMGWSDALLGIPAGNCAIALVAATYIGTLLGGFSSLQISIVAAAIVVITGVVNMFGTKVGSTISSILFAIKVIAIFGITIVCFLLGGNTGDPVSFTITDGSSPVTSVIFAVVAVLWCFDGWNSICHMGGEIENPQKNIPRVMSVTVIGIMVIYLLFNMAVLHVVPVADIIASENVTYDVMELIFGKGISVVVTIIIVCSMLGSFNGSVMVYPRELYAMACDHRWFGIFRKTTKKTGEPWVADIYLIVMMVFYCFAASARDLVNIITLNSWIFYVLVLLGVIIMHRRDPEYKGYKAPLYPVLPILMALFAIAMLVVNFLMDSTGVLGLLIPLTGIPAYIFFKMYNKKHGIEMK